MPEASDTAELVVAALEAQAASVEPVNGIYVELPKLLYDRVLALLNRPLVKWVHEYYETEQGRLPLVIRDGVRALLAKLAPDDVAEILAVNALQAPLAIETLRFDTSLYDNGYFFTATPILVTTDGVELDWEDVFGQTDQDLDEFTGDLSDVFGPCLDSSILEIDMETGTAMNVAK
jgi:hypothetical protein